MLAARTVGLFGRPPCVVSKQQCRADIFLLKNAAPVARSRSSKNVIRAAQAGYGGGDGTLEPNYSNQGNTAKDGSSSLSSKGPSSPFGPLFSFVKAYNEALSQHPVAVKAATSLLGFLIGDIVAQSFNPEPFDVLRCMRLSLYGGMIDGPVGHFFYQFLDRRIFPDEPKSNKAVLTKTSVDQLIWAPTMTVVFLTFLTTLEGRPETIATVLQTKLLPILAANFTLWPMAHLVNFKFVPPEQRILFNNVVAIVWTTWLSWKCGGPVGGGHAGTPRDALAAGIPCAGPLTAAMMQSLESHHVADAVRQTNAVESVLTGWGTDGLPHHADAGAELLMNYLQLKTQVVKEVCGLQPPVFKF